MIDNVRVPTSLYSVNSASNYSLNACYDQPLWMKVINTIGFVVGSQSDSTTISGNASKDNSQSSSRGVIPQAKIRTIKMTLVIVLGTYHTQTLEE